MPSSNVGLPGARATFEKGVAEDSSEEATVEFSSGKIVGNAFRLSVLGRLKVCLWQRRPNAVFRAFVSW